MYHDGGSIGRIDKTRYDKPRGENANHEMENPCSEHSPLFSNVLCITFLTLLLVVTVFEETKDGKNGVEERSGRLMFVIVANFKDSWEYSDATQVHGNRIVD